MSLSGENIPIIESAWLGFEMPLTDERGAITSASQQFWKGLLFGIKRIKIGALAVGVTVLTGENGGAAWRANGIAAGVVL